MTKAAVPYWQVDAFTAQPLGGNTAGVLLVETSLSDEVMARIAQETGLPATAFVQHDGAGEADWAICWFSPHKEIALCGHASLAAGHALLGRGGGDSVSLRTRRSGVITVQRLDEGYEVALPAIATEAATHADAITAIGGEPQEVVRSQLGYNILCYGDEAAVRSLTPDMAALAKLGSDQFIVTAPGDTTDIVSRVFVPGGGADEDAVTGSAHSALAPYWAGRLGRSTLTAHQASERGGDLTLRLEGERVWVGGQCVTVVEGTFTL